ncbi:unnamed protein product, partial [Iphiclides podalirius]
MAAKQNDIIGGVKIVRNKAAEKAKHAHNQQQQQQQEQEITSAQGSVVSVITHAGNAPGTTAVLSPTTEQHVTNTGSYSINGILGIEQVEGLHNGTPTGLKRKRHEDQATNDSTGSNGGAGEPPSAAASPDAAALVVLQPPAPPYPPYAHYDGTTTLASEYAYAAPYSQYSPYGGPYSHSAATGLLSKCSLSTRSLLIQPEFDPRYQHGKEKHREET